MEGMGEGGCGEQFGEGRGKTMKMRWQGESKIEGSEGMRGDGKMIARYWKEGVGGSLGRGKEKMNVALGIRKGNRCKERRVH